jgi:hypothetical protein
LAQAALQSLDTVTGGLWSTSMDTRAGLLFQLLLLLLINFKNAAAG